MYAVFFSEVKEEAKPLEKSQSEIDRENAKRLLAELEAKKKKEKQGKTELEKNYFLS